MIENYRADVLDKLGIGWDVLREARPDIVLVSMAGFGKTGAERDLVGFGPIIEQMAGMASITGYGDDGIPYKTGISYGDPIGGLAAAGAVVLALIARRRTGRGAWIDLAQRETMAQMIGPAFAAAVAARRGAGPPRQPRTRASRRRACTRARARTSGSRSRRATTREWRALARAIGAPELEALPLAERRARHDELDRRIEAWTRRAGPARGSRGAAARRRLRRRACVDASAIHDDPHLAARGFWVELPHPKMHDLEAAGVGVAAGRGEPAPRRHAPLFGEHNREILCGLLGHAESRARRARVRARHRDGRSATRR